MKEIISKKREINIAIIGLGYVGLPLAVEFSKFYKVNGIDIDKKRIEELQAGHDFTLEIDENSLKYALNFNNKTAKIGLSLSNDISTITNCNVYIITVPTPTDKHNRPLLDILFNATKSVANVLKKGDIVIFESTVYPGVTEEECVPILEKFSDLKFNTDFFVGYSPERINPGDKEHTLSKIKKITSGSNKLIADEIDQIYNSIISAGTFKATSIKVAEAAKVIENAQRDINIAFVNELAKIFNLLNIDTSEVLEAASTKWNFLNFKPGLVGGHCIGVDPYYLAQKAQEVGYHPEIILAGRRTNDSMGKYIALETIKLMMKKNIQVINSNVLILGFTFKENCPDTRNTKVIDIYNELILFDINVEIYDPWADLRNVKSEYGIDLLKGFDFTNQNKYSAIIIAVSHSDFYSYDLSKSNQRVLFDVKSMLSIDKIDARL
jgi:UDP-N-acetyl-D-galactosamine dehydrogenase